MPFPYFGRKKQLAKQYPPPEYDTIIEPFAGSAGYSISFDYWERQVILVELNPLVVSLWEWLIDSSVTADTIREIPDVERGQSLDDIGERGSPRRMLVESVGASKDPRYKTASGWMARDWSKTRERIANDLHKIKHWQIIEGDYALAPDVEATWFIDPPYQRMLKDYESSPYVTKALDFDELAEWCLSRRGQVIVCEETEATWLPFRPLKETKTISNKKLVEAVWVSTEHEEDEEKSSPLSPLVSHPCPFPDSTVELIASHLPPDRYPTVIDPFAGVGKIHSLPNQTLGIEIEPEWANQAPLDDQKPYEGTIVGDALNLEVFDGEFSAAATSPCFGNRMADHHDAKDTSKRNTYKHKLGRDPSPNSASILHWGPEYRRFHKAAWVELTRVVEPGGRFVLNIKNHIRKGVEQRVSEWHMTTLIRLGWKLVAIDVISTPGLGYGANRDLRTDHEYLYVFDAIWTRVKG